MQPSDLFRYFFLAITVAASHANAQDHTHDGLENKQEKRLGKREATLFIDNYPIVPISRQAPDIIYRRLSKKRYRNPKPKYGPPSYKYRSTKPRKPYKKYRQTVKTKYGPPSYKKRPTRTSYGPPKPAYKPVYGPPKKIPNSYYAAEPDFGEPPQDFRSDFQKPKQSFGEPPLNSYVAPPHTGDAYDQYPSNTNSGPSTGYDDADSFDQEFGSWQNYQNDQGFDNSYAYSKKHAVFVKPESFVKPEYSTYGDHTQSDKLEGQDPVIFIKKRKPHINESFKSGRTTPKSKGQEVIVGGRYAEPPARYVNKVHSATVNDDDDEFGSNEFIDPDVAISAAMSPYINYKNSNMAFSPQNLNDAFSIVDK